tara:strand:- start:5029 stop:5661 length:633 start_codon:yes stop_codon:yes gene_type:complete
MASTIQVDNIKDIGGNTMISSNGSGTFTSNLPASAPNVSTATGTLPIANGGTGAATFVAAGLANTPGFEARLTGSQDVSDATQTLVSVNQEVYDSDSCYDTSTYRFTPTTAGKYYCYGTVCCVPSADNVLKEAMTSFRFNGTRTRTSSTTFNASTFATMTSPFVSEVLTFNGSSDYVELWGRCGVSSGTPRFSSAHATATYFGAYRIIGV